MCSCVRNETISVCHANILFSLACNKLFVSFFFYGKSLHIVMNCTWDSGRRESYPNTRLQIPHFFIQFNSIQLFHQTNPIACFPVPPSVFLCYFFILKRIFKKEKKRKKKGGTFFSLCDIHRASFFFFNFSRIMPEKNIVEDVIDDLVDNFTETLQKNKHTSSFFEQQDDTVSSSFNRLFGRQKPLHRVLGGGRSADVLLWRNKKISASVLMGATAVWVLFEWINFHFLSLVCYSLLLGMIAQFVWCNASGLLNRSESRVPRLVLPKDFFADVGVTIGTEINHGLLFLQDLSCKGNLKQFLAAVLGLWAAAIIGSCCNFLTVLYIGFVGAHTLPVLYERYEDEVDGFVDSLLMKFHSHYKKIDSGFLSRFPSGKFGLKKRD